VCRVCVRVCVCVCVCWCATLHVLQESSKEKNPVMCTLDNSFALFNLSVPTRVLVCRVAGAAGGVQGKEPCNVHT
jgi:hypothetical protein